MASQFRPGAGMVLADAVPGEPLIVFKDVRLGFDARSVDGGTTAWQTSGRTVVTGAHAGSA